MNRSRSAMTLTCTTLTCTTVAAALVLTGCKAVDRAGGTAAVPVTTLTFAQPNDEPPDQLLAWAEQVEEVSDGSVLIAFENEWHRRDPRAEALTLDDVAAGEVDLAWVGARAFDRAGVTDFQALLAPMAVDSHDLQEAVFDAGIPEEMLAGVSGAGVQGLAVLPGPLRRMMGVEHPFVTPDDFAGQLVGMQDSALSEETLTRLGARTKALPGGADITGVDGYEQQLASIAGNAYYARAKYVTTNLNFWPRPLVIVANPAAYDALTDAQRAALRTASESAVPLALAASRAEDADAVAELCTGGMTLSRATQDQLDELATAVSPMYYRLLDDATSGEWFSRIIDLKEEVGAPPDAATCPDPDEPTRIDDLTGTWTTRVTLEDFERAGVSIDPIEGTFTLRFADGLVVLTGPDGEVGFNAQYRTFKGRLVTSGHVDEINIAYRVTGSRLVMTDMKVNGGYGGPYDVVWTSHPWTRQD